MAQGPDAHSCHGAIDASAESSCCAVCMEPADWVAAGPCGHREVCVNCAVRMRFFQDDRRCCICRALCSTVVITKSDDGGQPDADAFSKPSGKYFFYHGGMAAYFADREQYEAARKSCSLKPPCPAPATDADERPGTPPPVESSRPRSRLGCFLFSLALILILGAGVAALCVAGYSGVFNPVPRLPNR